MRSHFISTLYQINDINIHGQHQQRLSRLSSWLFLTNSLQVRPLTSAIFHSNRNLTVVFSKNLPIMGARASHSSQPAHCERVRRANEELFADRLSTRFGDDGSFRFAVTVYCTCELFDRQSRPSASELDPAAVHHVESWRDVPRLSAGNAPVHSLVIRYSLSVVKRG